MMFVEWLNHDRTVLKTASVTTPQEITIRLPGRTRRVHSLQTLPASGHIWTFTPKRTQRTAFEYFTRKSANVGFQDTPDGSLNVQLKTLETIECRVIIPPRRLADWGAESTAGFRVTWHPDGEPFTDEEKRRIAQAQYSKAANTMVATQNVLLL